MPLTPEQIHEALGEAHRYMAEGKFAGTDLICQSLLAQDIPSAEAILILGQVASAIGEFDTARRYFEQSRAFFPDVAADGLAKLTRLIEQRNLIAATSPRRQRFHLIKAWGFGFTSDLDHTLGHLLLAEMSGRIPVIHWGQNCLFRDGNIENAWTQFFEPVSPFGIRDLIRGDLTFFPAKWSAGNLHREELNKWEGHGSKTAGIMFLNQSADVTVADFFTAPIELLPWQHARNPMALPGQVRMLEIEQAYQYLIGKYLKPKPHVAAAVDGFAAAHFNNRRLQAVHVRGGDKVVETPDIADMQQAVFEAVQTDLAADPLLWIFLLTDDSKLLDTYRTAFPGRIITTDSLRTTGTTGVHYSPPSNRSQLGFEVLRDALLAARCERFLGIGTTNVSNFILHLKPWPFGTIRLVGPVTHHQRSTIIL